MKKMILMAVAMLSMTTATFADNSAKEETEATYAFNVNMGSLAETLDLTIDQADAVADVHKTFSAEMLNASASENEDERNELMNKAINKDLKYMHYILSSDQYHKYLRILNTTLSNRGLNK